MDCRLSLSHSRREMRQASEIVEFERSMEYLARIKGMPVEVMREDFVNRLKTSGLAWTDLFYVIAGFYDLRNKVQMEDFKERMGVNDEMEF